MTAMLIEASKKPREFDEWLFSIETNCWMFEVVINEGYIMKVLVHQPDNGDWSDVEYGRVEGSNGLRYKQKVFQPAILGDKFIVNHNGKREKR